MGSHDEIVQLIKSTRYILPTDIEGISENISQISFS